MATSFLTEQSAGAPALSGTNGALCAVLDWALVQQGWAIEYASGNARVYRPGSGNRFRLHVNHDSTVSGAATLATMRGCENASAAATLVDPFPTVAQVANNASSFCVSSAANTTARPYKIVVTPTLVIMAVGTTGVTDSGWDLFLFGDVAPAYSGDTFNTLILIGSTSSLTPTSRGMNACIGPTAVSSNKLFWCRSIDGSIKSTHGQFAGSVAASSPGNFCTVTGTPGMRLGYQNQISREKLGATCIGSSTTTAGGLALVRRGWVPQLWNPMHTSTGGVTADDTFTDSAYAVGSSFVVVPASTSIAAIIETTDTWSAPSG